MDIDGHNKVFIATYWPLRITAIDRQIAAKFGMHPITLDVSRRVEHAVTNFVLTQADTEGK